MINVVIFDIDGVLVDSEPNSFKSMNLLLGKYGFQLDKTKNQKYTGMSNSNILKGINKKYHLGIPVKWAVEEKERIYERITKKLRVFSGVVPLLECLKRNRIRIIAASSGTRDRICFNLERSGLAKYFSHRISGEDFFHSKPNPQIFLKAASLLNVKPQECVVVEDTVNGILAAKNAGMKCIAVTNTYPAAGLKKADLVVSSLKEVAFDTIVKLGGKNGKKAVRH